MVCGTIGLNFGPFLCGGQSPVSQQEVPAIATSAWPEGVNRHHSPSYRWITAGPGRGCVKTRNAIRVRSILFVFQKKTSQNCTWVHQKRIVEALKTSQRGFLHTLGPNRATITQAQRPPSIPSPENPRCGCAALNADRVHARQPKALVTTVLRR